MKVVRILSSFKKINNNLLNKLENHINKSQYENALQLRPPRQW